MLYLPTRWETNIGKGNKNMTSIWRAIKTAKTNNEVLRTPILISFIVLNCAAIFTDNKLRVEMVIYCNYYTQKFEKTPRYSFTIRGVMRSQNLVYE